MSDRELDYDEEVAGQSTGDEVREGGQRPSGLADGANEQSLSHGSVQVRGQSSVARASPGQSSQRDDLVLKELRRLNSSMEQISDRVRHLESIAPPASKRRATESRRSVEDWADREDDDPGDRDDPQWSGEDASFTLSESNRKLLSSSFTTVLSNSERRKIRSAFPVPDVKETRCPRLDPIFKSATVKCEVKTADAELARLQAFVLDPVGPLTRVLHAMEEGGEALSFGEAQESIADAMRLLGNASSQIARLRRKKILKAVNPEIQDLADEDLFSTAAPDLFGQGFEQKMKERAESMKLLSSATKPPIAPKKFFRGSRPSAPQRGGGQASRGGRQWWAKSKTAPKKQ